MWYNYNRLKVKTMKYTYKKMNMEDAKEIASWRYDGFMKKIFMDPYFAQYNPNSKEMKGPGNCDGFVVYHNDQILGLFEYYNVEDVIEIGLALNSRFIGKGLSKEFILDGIEFGLKKYQYEKAYIKITVEMGNDVAYKAYLSAGFIEVNRNKEEILMRYYFNVS